MKLNNSSRRAAPLPMCFGRCEGQKGNGSHFCSICSLRCGCPQGTWNQTEPCKARGTYHLDSHQGRHSASFLQDSGEASSYWKERVSEPDHTTRLLSKQR